MTEGRIPRSARIAFLGILIFGMALIASLEASRVRATPDGLHFQVYSSETMMQTVSAVDLRDHPLESLWYLHIQPPALDAIRAGLVQLIVRLPPPPANDTELIRRLDSAMYILWGFVYALCGGLVFLLLRETSGELPGLVGALLFFFHPAAIFYATFLEGTMLSAFGILLFFFCLHRLDRYKGSVLPLSLSVIFLFLTRSIFQWPFLIICTLTLMLLKISHRKTVSFFLGISLVVMAFLLKQYLLFGITLTSSFTGLNFAHTVEMQVDYSQNPSMDEPGFSFATQPAVLYRKLKVGGTTNFNHASYLRKNQELLQLAAKKLVSDGWEAWTRRSIENIGTYFLPSTRYSPHIIVDSLSWREAFDQVFSGRKLFLLLLLCSAIRALLGRSKKAELRNIAYLLPVFYIFAVSVFLERGENQRFKFFLEPIFLIFIVAQFHALSSAFIGSDPAQAHPSGSTT